jgi:hypothetical protein
LNSKKSIPIDENVLVITDIHTFLQHLKGAANNSCNSDCREEFHSLSIRDEHPIVSIVKENRKSLAIVFVQI